jgi:hypothetical protein
MSDQLFERAMHDWLESGSDRTPPAAIDAVLLAVKTTPQERDLRIPRRFNLMTFPMRLAAVVAILAVVGVGALTFFRGPGFGTSTPTLEPTASPLPTAMPFSTLAPLDPPSFRQYTSPLYGFTIGHPAEFVEESAIRPWSFEVDAAAFPADGSEDNFIGGPDGAQVRVSAWSLAVTPGTTIDAWIESYCTAQGEPCPSPRDRATDVTAAAGDQPAGLLLNAAGGATAFFLDADRIFVVRCWQSNDAPAVRIYGGCTPLIDAMARTFELREPPTEAPSPAPS